MMMTARALERITERDHRVRQQHQAGVGNPRRAAYLHTGRSISDMVAMSNNLLATRSAGIVSALLPQRL